MCLWNERCNALGQGYLGFPDSGRPVEENVATRRRYRKLNLEIGRGMDTSYYVRNQTLQNEIPARLPSRCSLEDLVRRNRTHILELWVFWVVPEKKNQGGHGRLASEPRVISSLPPSSPVLCPSLAPDSSPATPISPAPSDWRSLGLLTYKNRDWPQDPAPRTVRLRTPCFKHYCEQGIVERHQHLFSSVVLVATPNRLQSRAPHWNPSRNGLKPRSLLLVQSPRRHLS
ncbi:hypothetical protein VTI28DRAFT_5112 [Corynascus sepedonium]